MQIKKKHHYVWQHYLKSWATNGRVWCKRGDNIFETSTVNIAQIRYFYEVKELEESHVRLVTAMINKSHGSLRETHFDFLKGYQALHEEKRNLERVGKSSEALEAAFRPFLINYEEDYHSHIEKNSVKHLDAIKSNDTSFFCRGEERVDFSHFLCVQYMRTKRQKEAFLNEVCMPQCIDAENAWPVIRHILAVNVAWGIYSGPFKMVLLENSTSISFITGDQPVINTYAVDNDEDVENLEFYYPLTPRRAILITERKDLNNTPFINLNEEQVKTYNRGIFSMSHEQIYANSKEALENIS